MCTVCAVYICILLTKITAARNGAALSYPRVRGLYFLAVVFVTTIYIMYHYTIIYTFIILIKTNGTRALRFNKARTT